MRIRATIMSVLAIIALVGCGSRPVHWADNVPTDGEDSTDGTGDDGTSTGTGDDGSTSNGEDGSTTGGDGDDVVMFDECAAVAEFAHNIYQPLDVIIAVDNTPSMYNEIQEVRENLGRFSQMVSDQGFDMRVVMISCRSQECLVHEECDTPPCWHTICIPPPLGVEGGCEEGADDTNLPEFLHLDSMMPSLKSLERIIWAYEEYEGNMRPNAAHHILVVSDDNDYWSADQFEEELFALDGRNRDYTFHGVYAFMNKYEACDISSDEPCCIYAAPDGAGTVYRELVERTGGIAGDMCLQDFDPFFDELAGAVVESVGLSCEWVIPAPPNGGTLDPALVNIQVMDTDGNATRVVHVESAADCGAVEDGWYYDNNAEPTQIFVCEQTCAWLQDFEGAAMKLLFGCETVEESLI